jgi:hypothetical protein
MIPELALLKPQKQKKCWVTRKNGTASPKR